MNGNSGSELGWKGIRCKCGAQGRFIPLMKISVNTLKSPAAVAVVPSEEIYCLNCQEAGNVKDMIKAAIGVFGGENEKGRLDSEPDGLGGSAS